MHFLYLYIKVEIVGHLVVNFCIKLKLFSLYSAGASNTLASSLNKMTLNPNASSWTPRNQAASTSVGSWVNAAEFVPESSKKMRALPKNSQLVDMEREGKYTGLNLSKYVLDYFSGFTVHLQQEN